MRAGSVGSTAPRIRATIPAPACSARDLVGRAFTAPAPSCLCGRRRHLYPHVFRLGVGRIRARRVLPPDRRLAGLDLAVHQLGVGCLGDGHLLAHPPGRRPEQLGPSLRQRCSVPRDAVHRTTGRRLCREFGWQKRRFVRQRHGAASNSLFKAELIRKDGPWNGIDDAEIADAEYIDWFNHRRLHGEIGWTPGVEYEQH